MIPAVGLVVAVAKLGTAIVEKLPPSDPETRRARIAAHLQIQLARLQARQERWKARRG